MWMQPTLLTTLGGYVSGADNDTYTDNGTVKATLAYSDDTENILELVK